MREKKIVERMAAQGDVLFLRIEKLPDDVELVDDKAVNVTVAHSETGHHHVATPQKGQFMAHYRSSEPLTSYLVGEGIDVVHHREHHTHAPLNLRGSGEGKQIFKIRRQREWTPKGWRVAQD